MAAALRVGRTCLANWPKRGRIPPAQWPAIVDAANSLGLAGVTYDVLRGIEFRPLSPEGADLPGEADQVGGDLPAQHGDDPVGIGGGVERRRVELGNEAFADSARAVGG